MNIQKRYHVINSLHLKTTLRIKWYKRLIVTTITYKCLVIIIVIHPCLPEWVCPYIWCHPNQCEDWQFLFHSTLQIQHHWNLQLASVQVMCIQPPADIRRFKFVLVNHFIQVPVCLNRPGSHGGGALLLLGLITFKVCSTLTSTLRLLSFMINLIKNCWPY